MHGIGTGKQCHKPKTEEDPFSPVARKASSQNLMLLGTSEDPKVNFGPGSSLIAMAEIPGIL